MLEPPDPGRLTAAFSGTDARALAGVLETVLYHDGGSRAAIERFYGRLLGLPAVAGWEDGVAYRVGPGILPPRREPARDRRPRHLAAERDMTSAATYAPSMLRC